MKRVLLSLFLILVFAGMAAGSVLLAAIAQERLTVLQREVNEIEAERAGLAESNGAASVGKIDDRVVAAWRDHYKTVTAEFQNNLASALRQGGGAITESKSPSKEFRQFGPNSTPYTVFEQTIVGDLSTVLNVLGELERRDPLLRVERIRLSRGGETIDCFLKVAVPEINLKGVGQ